MSAMNVYETNLAKTNICEQIIINAKLIKTRLNKLYFDSTSLPLHINIDPPNRTNLNCSDTDEELNCIRLFLRLVYWKADVMMSVSTYGSNRTNYADNSRQIEASHTLMNHWYLSRAKFSRDQND